MEKAIKIVYIGSDPVVGFAAEELGRYLSRVTGQAPEMCGAQACALEDREGLWLGTFEAFGPDFRAWPGASVPAWDDALYIEAEGAQGIIAGSNSRAVLLAVYRYLTELGCRWVRPGGEGECLPPVEIAHTEVRVVEAASNRHRGVCIEGAVSYENVRDIIDWMPKLGFNTYFMQFREAYTFFERWYSHRNNPLKEAEPFSVEKAREFKAGLVREMKRRGMLFHDVGHGWTCEPFGIAGLGWEYEAPPVPEEAVPYLAEVNGKRELWGGVPLNTNLCYSNRKVRDIINSDIAQFAQAHPEVDVIHFWLADGSNNQCECESCRAMRPADWYVKMLNELDERMQAAKVPTRVVFLIYVDLLWPPEKERIQSPDRFILMFAPITRTYSREFAAEGDLPDLPPYVRNKLDFPRSVEANVAFLRAWKKIFQGDSFDFDYHFMWDHFKDPGYTAIAEVLHKDLANLKALGLNGLVSCQEQRIFFPTGLGMTVMGKTLWKRDADFDRIARDYFASAFGLEGNLALDYMKDLSRLFDPPYIRGEKPVVNPQAAATYARIPAVIARFQPVIHRNLNRPDPCHVRSWYYLDAHAGICLELALALQCRAEGRNREAAGSWQRLQRIVQEQEDDLQPVFDVYEFILTLRGIFGEGSVEP
ncbi:MAG: DUF4838 domain-containing protein [Armatimonadetes bacterium]|nr:DUF4838 domain-containing protein [Armatimonadota bacterium]